MKVLSLTNETVVGDVGMTEDVSPDVTVAQTELDSSGVVATQLDNTVSAVVAVTQDNAAGPESWSPAGVETEMNDALSKLRDSLDGVPTLGSGDHWDGNGSSGITDPIEMFPSIDEMDPIESFSSVQDVALGFDDAEVIPLTETGEIAESIGLELASNVPMRDDPDFFADVMGDSPVEEHARCSNFSSSARDVGFQQACMQLKPKVPEYIWEATPFMRAVFGKDVLPFPVGSSRPDIPIDVDSTPDLREMLKRPRVERTGSLSEKTLKYVPKMEDESKRCSILADWACLVGVSPEAFNVGRLVIDDGNELTHENLMSSITHCFAGKATATLAKRFYAMNRFVSWCSKHGYAPFPVKERILYIHLQWLLAEKFAASAGRSLLEAVRFCSGVLGMDEDIRVRGMNRLTGVATSLSMTAGPIEQALPLNGTTGVPT